MPSVDTVMARDTLSPDITKSRLSMPIQEIAPPSCNLPKKGGGDQKNEKLKKVGSLGQCREKEKSWPTRAPIGHRERTEEKEAKSHNFKAKILLSLTDMGRLLLAMFATLWALSSAGNPGIKQEDLDTEPITDSSTLSALRTPSDKPGEMDAVIFEPLDQVKISLSKFQVISIYSFKPYVTAMSQMLRFVTRMTISATQMDYAGEPSTALRTQGGMFVPTFKSLRAAIAAMFNETKTMGQRLVQALDLMHDHTDRGANVSSSKAGRDLHNLIACMSLIDPQAGLSDPRTHTGEPVVLDQAQHTEENPALYCGCLLAYEVDLPRWDPCKDKSMGTYVQYTRVHGVVAGAVRLDYQSRRRRSTRSQEMRALVKPYCNSINVTLQEELDPEGLNSLCPQITKAPVTRALSRKKRFLDTLLLGIATYSKFKFTDRTINHLKKNIKILDGRTQQNRKAILAAFNLMNLTMLELGEHRRTLSALDERAIHLQRRVLALAEETEANLKGAVTNDHFTAHMWALQNTLTAFQSKMTDLYAYLDAITSQQVTPKLITPSDLRDVLSHAEQQIGSFQRLSLPADPQNNIWIYYRILRLVPAMVDDHLVLSLQIPLSDVATQLNLYRVHNLPLLHPKLKIRFRYNLENNYLAVLTNGTYYMLPSERQVTLCLATQGAWCQLTEPLYTLEKVPTCITSLYLKDSRLIAEHCGVSFTRHTTPTAVQIKPHVWLITVLEETTGSISCLNGHQLVTIRPPSTTITLPQSCSAVIGSQLYLLPSASLSSTEGSVSLQRYPFLVPYLEYRPEHHYRIFQNLNISEMKEEVRTQRTLELLKYDELTIPQIQQTLQPLDYKYPKPTGLAKLMTDFWPSIKVPMIIVIVLSVLIATVVGVLYFCPNVRYQLIMCITRRKLNRSRLNIPHVTYSPSQDEEAGNSIAFLPRPDRPVRPLPDKPRAARRVEFAPDLIEPRDTIRELKLEALRKLTTACELKKEQNRSSSPTGSSLSPIHRAVPRDRRSVPHTPRLSPARKLLPHEALV